jgi:hypothetical protein
MVTVAGLCRTLTGFAAAQCVVEEDNGRSLALRAAGATEKRPRIAGGLA